MNNQARDRLRELIAQYGTAAFQTPHVLQFQVGQALQDMPDERNALVAALKLGFVDQIRAEPAALERLAGEFKAKSELSESQATWALESWRELVFGVRSKSLDRGDAYFAHEKTKGISYRPPTREQFGRAGLIAGILAGLLVGAFWGGVKAVSLGKPIHRSYGSSAYGDHESLNYAYNGGRYYGHRTDLQFTNKGIVAWLGWIVAGGLIGSVVGGTSALYLSHGSMKFVGGYSGAVVGAVAGLANGHWIIQMAPAHTGAFSDILAQALAVLIAGVVSGILLGGFRDLIRGLRGNTMGIFLNGITEPSWG